MNRLVFFVTAVLTFAGAVSTPVVRCEHRRRRLRQSIIPAQPTRESLASKRKRAMAGIYIVGTAFHGIRVTKFGFETIDFPGAAVTAAVEINPGGDIVAGTPTRRNVPRLPAGTRGLP